MKHKVTGATLVTFPCVNVLILSDSRVEKYVFWAPALKPTGIRCHPDCGVIDKFLLNVCVSSDKVMFQVIDISRPNV